MRGKARLRKAGLAGLGAVWLAVPVGADAAGRPAGREPVRIQSSYAGPSKNSSEAPFSFETFVERIRSGGATTVESAVQLLPRAIRDRYALMHRSRSLQSASFQAPRAILFESDGSFLATFNGGDPLSRGHDKIEIIQFRPDERRWEFREIAFARGSPPRVSEANPRKCLECHQSPRRQDVDPRPNWEPYSTWPGAYASVDGNLGQTLEASGFPESRLRPEDAPMLEEQKREAGELQAFMSGVKPSHPRYRELGPFKGRALLHLTDVLVAANAYRAARLMRETPLWEVFEDLFLDSFLCSSFGPGGSRALTPRSTPLELRELIEPIAASMIPSVHLDGFQLSHRMSLFFESRGVDTSDWSMDFKTGGRFAFRDRFGSPSYPDDQFLEALNWEFRRDAPLSCGEAQARFAANAPSLRASGRLAEAAASIREHEARASQRRFSPEAALAKCARCHGSGANADAPEIPFDDLARLQPKLNEPHRRGGQLFDEIERRVGDLASFDEQMPPSGQAPPAERAALLDFLRGLRR